MSPKLQWQTEIIPDPRRFVKRTPPCSLAYSLWGGAHYVLPVQAKGGADRIGIVQIEQDLAVCAAKFPGLICRSIAAQFIQDDVIALFELEQTADGIKVSLEKHYRLVRPEELSPQELETYRHRPM